MPDPQKQRIKSLIAEADALVVADPQQAMATAQRALALARDARDDESYGQALCSYAATLFFQSKYTEAREAYLEAQHVGRTRADQRLMARAVNGLGITSRALGEYGAAMEFFLSSLQLTQEAGDEAMRLRVLSNIGLIHSQLGDHALSLSLQLEVMASAHTLSLPLVESAAAVNAVVASHDLGDFQAALAMIDERLPVTRHQGNQLNEMLLQTYQALSLLALDRPGEAVAPATAALQQAQDLGNEDSVAQLHTTLGHAYHRLGQVLLARDHLEQATAQGQRVGQLRESRALKILSELEADQGNWQAAYTLSQRQQVVERELQEQTTQRNVQVLSAQMQLELLKREAAASRSRAAELEEHVAQRTRELQRVNDMLQHAAFHDSLTGLGNRSLFHQYLGRVMQAGTQGAGLTYAVLFLDCDRFKQINDTLGHDVGDQVLRAFAARLQATLPPAPYWPASEAMNSPYCWNRCRAPELPWRWPHRSASRWAPRLPWQGAPF
ncbi:diguanylate cyclase domain-containing protein [Deinococcus malanensis]|uniref:diguanylate cyclase domain-containing protein n=1 Tax=Deinococcus malanensis TaxID=1706855 RepID=UPI00362888A9